MILGIYCWLVSLTLVKKAEGECAFHDDCIVVIAVDAAEVKKCPRRSQLQQLDLHPRSWKYLDLAKELVMRSATGAFQEQQLLCSAGTYSGVILEPASLSPIISCLVLRRLWNAN